MTNATLNYFRMWCATLTPSDNISDKKRKTQCNCSHLNVWVCSFFLFVIFLWEMNKLQTAGTLFRFLNVCVRMCVSLFLFSFTNPFRYLQILISLVNRCFLTRLTTSTLHIRIQLCKVGRTWKNKNSALVLLIVSHLWNLYWLQCIFCYKWKWCYWSYRFIFASSYGCHQLFSLSISLFTAPKFFN